MEHQTKSDALVFNLEKQWDTIHKNSSYLSRITKEIDGDYDRLMSGNRNMHAKVRSIHEEFKVLPEIKDDLCAIESMMKKILTQMDFLSNTILVGMQTTQNERVLATVRQKAENSYSDLQKIEKRKFEKYEASAKRKKKDWEYQIKKEEDRKRKELEYQKRQEEKQRKREEKAKKREEEKKRKEEEYKRKQAEKERKRIEEEEIKKKKKEEEELKKKKEAEEREIKRKEEDERKKKEEEERKKREREEEERKKKEAEERERKKKEEEERKKREEEEERKKKEEEERLRKEEMERKRLEEEERKAREEEERLAAILEKRVLPAAFKIPTKEKGSKADLVKRVNDISSVVLVPDKNVVEYFVGGVWFEISNQVINFEKLGGFLEKNSLSKSDSKDDTQGKIVYEREIDLF